MMLLCSRTRIILTIRQLRFFNVSSSCQPSLFLFRHSRFLSTKNIFGQIDTIDSKNIVDIPSIPAIQPIKQSIQEIYNSKLSVINELELFSWWKPSGYFRYVLEYIHMNLDIPWWATIMCATCILRLALIYVPIMSQRFVAKQSQFTPELNEFRLKIQDAKRENNMALVQQILIEQRDFLRSKGIRYGRQIFILGINGTVFLTQFFAIKKMIAVNYPGFSTGGLSWFQDLTACDPYYILPIISSGTLSLVMRMGVESGTSTDQMTPFMRVGMQYGLPFVTLIMASQFSSGICLYWCTSNIVSLLYSNIFKISFVRKTLNLPVIIKHKNTSRNSITEAWKNFKSERNAPPSINKLRENDANQFKKAGRGKPAIEIE